MQAAAHLSQVHLGLVFACVLLPRVGVPRTLSGAHQEQRCLSRGRQFRRIRDGTFGKWRAVKWYKSAAQPGHHSSSLIPNQLCRIGPRVPELLKAANMVAFNASGVELVEVVQAEVNVGLASRQLVDHHHQAEWDGNGSLLATPAPGYATELRMEVAGLGLNARPGSLSRFSCHELKAWLQVVDKSLQTSPSVVQRLLSKFGASEFEYVEDD